MKDKKEISVFIASPGDVTEERKIVRDVCNELNKSPLIKLHNISFEVTGREDVFPSAGRPQEIINQLVNECDIFVCIFHRKFGSPTGKEESGTLEEFLFAYNSWESTWKHLKMPKPHIMLYFKEVTIRSKKDIDTHLEKIMDLKAAFKASERHKIKDMVILGKPGSGKTTLLKYVLLSLVDGKGMERLGIEKQLIPFFAPLRELKDPDLESFTDFVKRVCSLSDFSISETVFRKLLDDGQGIILLDGLDEVSNKDIRAKTRTWIDKARKQFPCTRFIITSRYTGYSGTSRFEGGGS